VRPSRQEEFFPWLSSAPDGRVDLVFYDRSRDTKAQAPWTGNGPHAEDVFSGRATFVGG
jgi:hypothetical protein